MGTPQFTVCILLHLVALPNTTNAEAFDSPLYPKPKGMGFTGHSYKTSSAFAIALEYKLEAEGIPVFVDRSIPRGDPWHPKLEATVKNCPYFVCLLTPMALDSKWVRQEIEWAKEQTRIPIRQPGFEYDQESDDPDWFKEFVAGNQAISVYEESAEAYHDAVEKLLNRLGYDLL